MSTLQLLHLMRYKRPISAHEGFGKAVKLLVATHESRHGGTKMFDVYQPTPCMQYRPTYSGATNCRWMRERQWH